MQGMSTKIHLNSHPTVTVRYAYQLTTMSI